MAKNPHIREKQQTRDLSAYFDSLAGWVKQHVDPVGETTLARIEPTPEDSNGFVGESFILEVASHSGQLHRGETRRCLLKRKPMNNLFFLEHDFDAEARIQKSLAKSQIVPIADFIGYEPDSSVLDSPFYVIEFVDGKPTTDSPSPYHSGWLKESTIETQYAVCRSGLEALGKLHQHTIEQLGVEFLDRSEDGQTILERDLAFWDRFSSVSWFNNEPVAVAKEAREWLEANKPAQGHNFISWGDARPGNMLFRDTECKAIIDWDLVSAGHLEKDLGYWLFFDLQFEYLAETLGDAHLPGWPSRTEMVDIYEQALGKPLDRRRLRFYRIYAGWAGACLYSRFFNVVHRDDEATFREIVNDNSPLMLKLRDELNHAHLPGDVD